jgi:hypothetical protein
MPVSPTYARELYDIAEWTLPEHLRPIDISQEEREEFRKAEQAFLESLNHE